MPWFRRPSTQDGYLVLQAGLEPASNSLEQTILPSVLQLCISHRWLEISGGSSRIRTYVLLL